MARPAARPAVRLTAYPGSPPAVLALPVMAPDETDSPGKPDRQGKPDGQGKPDKPDDTVGMPVDAGGLVPAELGGVLAEFLAETRHRGAAGSTQVLPRPGQRVRRVLLVGAGAGTEGDWRSAGAALARGLSAETAVTVPLPAGVPAEAVAGLVEGIVLAGYRYRVASAPDPDASTLNRVTLAVPAADADRPELAEAVANARIAAEATLLARDLTNTESGRKSPAWLADTIVREAERAGVAGWVSGPDRLRADGFGGILAVGGGSHRPPRLVELRLRPRGARAHVILVGKGITYDTGGIDLKPTSSMELMRKDMGGAGTIAAAMVGAARLGLPVKVTALLPLADNAVSGDAYRPGDVIRHYGGATNEVQNTDAEGRLVLADALAYAAKRLAPGVLVDLATLTGAQHVALGRGTAALFSQDDVLAEALAEAGEAAGERMWRLPLPEDYVEMLHSDVADLMHAPGASDAGAITAALFLREFTGGLRPHWAHLDMSGPAWSSTVNGVLAKGATGWGVRMLLRFLAGQAATG